MKPVFQTKFDKSNGDCFAACLASILEVPLEEVPYVHPTDTKAQEWWGTYYDWLDTKGFSLIYCAPRKIGKIGYHLKHYVSYKDSKTGKISAHCTVAKNGRLVHDPLPKTLRDRKIYRKPLSYGVLIPHCLD